MMGGPLLFRCWDARRILAPDDLFKVLPSDDEDGLGAVVFDDSYGYLTTVCIINCLEKRGSQIRFFTPLALDVVARDPDNVGLFGSPTSALGESPLGLKAEGP